MERQDSVRSRGSKKGRSGRKERQWEEGEM